MRYAQALFKQIFSFKCTVLLALALTIGQPKMADALTKEELKCFAKVGSNLIGPEKLDILELHLASSILAKYDTNCNGKLDPTEIAKIEQDAIEAVSGAKRSRDLDDLRLRILARGSIPIDDLAAPPKPKKEESNTQQFFLRRDRIDIGFAGKVPDFKDASGAAFSVTRDYLGSETILNFQGVLSYIPLRNTRVDEGKHGPGEAFLSGYAFGTFLEIDSSTSSKQPKPTKDKIVAGALGQFEIFSGPVFNRQLIAVSGYHQTDFFGEAKIFGAKATWEPTALRWGLGSRTRFTDLFDYTWRAFAAADFFSVDNPGRTNLKPDADFLWVGGGTSLKIWPLPDLWDSRIYLEAYPTYYYNTLNGTDAGMFTGTLGITIDPEGHAAIEVKYSSGKDYSTGVKSDRITGQLTVKY